MSVFMLGERITIRTRRYRGLHGGLGEPLIVEINGIGGLIVLRQGAFDQPPGTSIEIIGRRKPDRFLSYNDRVQLVETVYAFALAGEFTVRAQCTIPEIADEILIPAGVAKPWHPLLKFGAKKCAIFTQEFSEIDSRLGGLIVCGVPLAEDGGLVVANDETGWKMNDSFGPIYCFAGVEEFRVWDVEGRTCLDGILVAGPHGRGFPGAPLVSTQYRNPINFRQASFVLDVRGDIKPELTPHRSPPDRLGLRSDAGPGWRRLRRLAAKAHGKLWEKVITRFCTPTDMRTLWQLLALYDVDFTTLRRGFIWNRILIPSLMPTGELFFRPFSAMGRIPFSVGSPKPFAAEDNGTVVGLDAEMAAWQTSNGDGMVAAALRKAVTGMATLALNENIPVLSFHPPNEPDEMASSAVVFDHFDRHFSAMPFGNGLEGLLAAAASDCLLNRRHPVVAWLLMHKEITNENPNFAFLHSLAGTLLAEGALEALATGNLTERRHNSDFSLLGYRFRCADLGNLEGSLQPPYQCWHPNHGKFEISIAIFQKLAEVQPIDWNRNEEKRRLLSE